jgi:ABC-type sugar transport system permease subunit
MATQTQTQATTTPARTGIRPNLSFLETRRGRELRENITAYLFLTPGLLIIFTFGIFPIFYAGYVSLFQWRIRQGEYRGLENFVNAMGDVAYVALALFSVGLIIYGILTFRSMFRTAQENDIPPRFPLLALIPGIFFAGGLTLVLLRLITFFTQERAVELGYAQILGSIPVGLLLIAVGGGISFYLNRWQHDVAAKSPYAILPSFSGSATNIIFAIGFGLVLGWYTYLEFNRLEGISFTDYRLSLLRIGLMTLGLIILAASFLIWQWTMKQHGRWRTIIGLLTASAFIGAGLFFSTFWPVISRDGDPNFYKSLQVTIFYSMGTVPIQLAIALVLAYLLFQDIKGKAFFRIVFFIPYIAPAVATAGIFQVLFSLRERSMANQFINFITAGTTSRLTWLKEPTSAFSILGQTMGLEFAVDWTFGPSLALSVIILYNIWVFVGYNTVIFLAGLGNIPNSLYEAAAIDGAGRWQLFRHITLPLLSPITYLLSVLAVIGTFKAFTHIWVLRDVAALGTTDTASIYFFDTFFRGARFGYATSMAIVLFVIILILTLVQNKIAERRVFYG